MFRYTLVVSMPDLDAFEIRFWVTLIGVMQTQLFSLQTVFSHFTWEFFDYISHFISRLSIPPSLADEFLAL